jgi:hypothetical protein
MGSIFQNTLRRPERRLPVPSRVKGSIYMEGFRRRADATLHQQTSMID